MSKTIESILTRLANEHENNYASFPAFVENELSLDIYELVCKAAEEFAHQSPLSDEDVEKLAEKYADKMFDIHNEDRGLSIVSAFIAGFNSRQQGSEWIDVKNQLPEMNAERKILPVLVFDGKRRTVAYYFPDRFKTIEFEDWDDYEEKDYPYTENDKEKGCVWLRAGFYESVECDKCDGYWSAPLNITHWMPLPQPPKQ